MKKLLIGLLRKLLSAIDLNDLLATIGLLGLGVGFWLVWIPLGVIVPSGLLFWLAVVPLTRAPRG